MGAYEFQSVTASDKSISADTDKIPVAYYSVMGIKLQNEPENGIYIVLYDNGVAETKMKKK
jgi:hypothetical protein